MRDLIAAMVDSLCSPDLSKSNIALAVPVSSMELLSILLIEFVRDSRDPEIFLT